MPDAQYLSHSRMKLYADCGEKYRLQYIVGVDREPQGPLLGGIAVHELCERLESQDLSLIPEVFKDGGTATTMFRTFFTQLVKEEGGPDAVRWGGRKSKLYPHGEDFDWWLTFGPGMLSAFHRLRMYDEEQGTSMPHEFIEIEVRATLPSGSLVTTRLDAITINKDGKVGIRDYKTGRSRAEEKLQQVLYAHAVRETLDLDVSFCELVYLRSPMLDRTIFDPRPLHEAMVAWTRSVETGIQAKVYPMSPSSYCVSCSVRENCAWGKTLEGGSNG